MSEKFITDRINNLKYNDGVAFDIGANVGEYSRLLATKFALVYAFEPHPDNVKIINKNILPNIKVEEVAVSNTTGTCKLYTQPDNLITGHSISEDIVSHHNWQLDKKRFMKVPCITIDDFCSQQNVAPSFIKCDIEGGEAFIWETAIKTLNEHNITIALEIHYGVDVERLAKIFTDLNYKIEYDTPTWLSRHVWIDKP
jgi:FkbM family methyltransferase